MLVVCRECEKEISDKASSCPHCGYTGESKDERVLDYFERRARFGLWLSTILTIIGILLFLPAVMVGTELILGICALFAVPGILGIVVHGIRLSHIKESRRTGANRF
jgi:hypothetical protein